MSAPATEPNRLGVWSTDNGVDIAVAAPNAQALEVCFFSSPRPTAPETRYRLLGPQDGIWHGHIPGIIPGTFYGFRAWGPWDPDHGQVYNPYKLLLDPYARAISGKVELCSQTFSHQTDDDLYPIWPLQMDPTNSAPYTVRSVVCGPQFATVPGPQIPWEKTVIYEAHVRGLTMQMPGVPEELRGTYAGLAHPATISYLKNLGVTAIELLPIHAKYSEPFLTERGLSNYWGYSTLNYFSPEPSYATSSARELGPLAVLAEFRGMVSLLHEAGLEVLLDVVYNHTCEGGASGQCLSWRGLDNAMYYRLNQDDHAQPIDFTGCGNTLDSSHPRVIQMILDSLRYWAGDVGVDGFRFDLAVTSGRLNPDFCTYHPLFQACLDDPLLRSKKMIAEPWDLGPDGWRTTDFPLPFSSWNDRYRDTLRGFWLNDARNQARGDSRGSAPFELASRLSGSQDLYDYLQVPARRTPRCSINFVTAHDGFTLADLTTFDYKHNEANLENNRDGSQHNLSWNHGAEGSSLQSRSPLELLPDSAPLLTDLAAARIRSIHNLLGSILISAGTPMLCAGDEVGRTQFGNNNAYCQDNEISWIDWNLSTWQKDIHNTTRYLLQLRAKHPVFRPRTYLSGQQLPEDAIPDLSWYDRYAMPMSERQWHDPASRTLQMLRSGLEMADHDLLVVINGILTPQTVQLAPGRGLAYQLVWDSSWENPCRAEENGTEALGGQKVLLEPLSMQIYLSEKPAR